MSRTSVGEARAAARVKAVRLRPRSAVAIAMASFLGIVAFTWPFVVEPGAFGSAQTAPLMFGVLLVVVLGCTTLFASAIITGGVGPWLPYQMFGAAWVGLIAGLLPRVRGRAEIVMLAVYGAVAGYLFGFLLNLSFWPFSLDPSSSIAYLPGADFSEQWHRYLLFDAATSLGWDTGRAATTAVVILLVGPAVLGAFRRAARKAAFEAPVTFEPEPGVDAPAARP